MRAIEFRCYCFSVGNMLINWPLVCFTSHFGCDISQHPFNMSHDGGELLVRPHNVLFNDFFLKHDISNLHRINKRTGHDRIGQNTDSERRRNHVFIRFDLSI